MGQLAIHLVGDRPLLEHHHDITGALGERGDVDVDDPLMAVAGRAEVDLVFIHRRMALAHLIHQRQQWAAEGHEFPQHVAAQDRDRGLEEGLGRRVAVDDHAAGGNAHHRVRQGVEDRIVIVEPMGCGDHAAALH